MTDITANETCQQENLVDSLFSQGRFLMIHRQWMQGIGYRQAMILALLVDQWSYWRSKGRLQPDGSFYKVRQEIADEMGAGIKDVDAGIKRLEELGLISGKMVGVPAKKFIQLNFDGIMRIVEKTQLPSKRKSSPPEENPQEKQSIPFKGNLDPLKKERTETTDTETTENREETTVDIGNAKAPDLTLTHRSGMSCIKDKDKGSDHAIRARDNDNVSSQLPPHYLACIKSMPQGTQKILRDRFKRWPLAQFMAYVQPAVHDFLQAHPEWDPTNPRNAGAVAGLAPFQWPGDSP